MLNRDATEWSCNDPIIDAEHAKLHQLVSSLTAVVMNDHGTGLTEEAIDILRERMRLHFGLEEEEACRHDTDAARILRVDHAELQSQLEALRREMVDYDPVVTRQSLRNFVAALKKHDSEVDVPLFRMMKRSI